MLKYGGLCTYGTVEKAEVLKNIIVHLRPEASVYAMPFKYQEHIAKKQTIAQWYNQRLRNTGLRLPIQAEWAFKCLLGVWSGIAGDQYFVSFRRSWRRGPKKTDADFRYAGQTGCFLERSGQDRCARKWCGQFRCAGRHEEHVTGTQKVFCP
jgi:hypothetical protein